MSKTFAVSDIHGCYNTLLALMLQLTPHVKKDDIVVFLGDYVDGGPQTMRVVDKLIALEKKHPNWVFLYGNHEDLMLDALLYRGERYHSYDLWWEQGGKATAYSYYPLGMSKYDMAISQPKEHITHTHIDWLRQRPIYYQNDEYFFVHAGIDPKLGSIKANTDAADRLDIDAIKNMIWIRDEFIDDETDWGKKVIFGHTVDLHKAYTKGRIGEPLPCTPIICKNKIGIDTGVYPRGLGGLTAIELPSETIYYQPYVDESS